MHDFLLRLESIGDAQRHKYYLWTQGKAKMSPGALAGARSLMKRRPFVKIATGINHCGVPTKREVKGFKDYTSVRSGIGQRGVYYCYNLRQGQLYQIQEQISQKKSRRYWAVISGGVMIELSDIQAKMYAAKIFCEN